jgi:hypothetical protein
MYTYVLQAVSSGFPTKILYAFLFSTVQIAIVTVTIFFLIVITTKWISVFF